MSVKKPESTDRVKSAGRERPSVAITVRKGVFQPSTLWWLACVLLVVVFLPYIPWMIPDLGGLPEYHIGWDRVDVSPPPPGVPQDIVDTIRSDAALPDELSLLEMNLAEKLAVAFAAHPWIAEVEKVQVLRNRRVEIRLRYRRPMLLVETSRGFYPVDDLAVLLPPDDFSARSVEQFPIVRNVRSVPQGLAGEHWGDEVVTCAARLASALSPQGNLNEHWNRLGLVAILAPVPKSASPQAEDLSFELLTKGGSVVVWGRAPGVESVEPDAAEKIARLDQVLATRGSLDGPGGPFRIDIRHDVISMQALSERRFR